MQRYVASYLVHDNRGYTHGIVVRECESPEVFFSLVRKEFREEYPKAYRIHIGNICSVDDVATNTSFKFYEFE